MCKSKPLGLYKNHIVSLFITQVLSITGEALERVSMSRNPTILMGVVLLKTDWKINVYNLLHEKGSSLSNAIICGQS